MSSQLNNNFITTPTFLNSYISRQLNNIKEARIFKKERDDWTRLYHKMLKRLEVMINMQKQVQDMMKIAKEVNMTITEIKKTILKVSINNRTTNATNILEILEDLQYLWKIGYIKFRGY